MPALDLPARNQEILRAVVDIFVETGEPVGSRTLSKRASIVLSPATIRNIMSDLSEGGFLTKPHASAGRLPTDLGYRAFVDNLMDAREPTPEERLSIQRGCSRHAAQIGEVLTRTSRILSELTGSAGFVLLPGEERLQFKHVEFIRMSERRVLVVILSQSGVVQNRVVSTDEDLAQDDLDRISRCLNEEFAGLGFREVRRKIIEQMNHQREDIDQLYRRAMELSRQVFLEGDEEEGPDEDNLFVEGATRIFSQPDFAADFEKLRSLYRAFEEKGRLVKLLDRCLDASEVTILIGSESDIEDMSECSVIAQRYFVGDRPLGTIGIIGPKRMRYDRAVSLVEWTAISVSGYLSSGDAP